MLKIESYKVLNVTYFTYLANAVRTPPPPPSLSLSLSLSLQISQPYKSIGTTIESNIFSVHSIDRLFSFDFDKIKYIVLFARCTNVFLVMLNLFNFVKVRPKYFRELFAKNNLFL